MKLPNGYGSVVKLSGKRRKPWMVRKTTGYHIDPVKEKKVNEYIIIGYAATKTEGLQMLADYNRNPYDTKAAKMTFDEVYEEWCMKNGLRKNFLRYPKAISKDTRHLTKHVAFFTTEFSRI